MSGFAGEMRAGGGDPRRGLWLTFLSPFGLELAGGCGAEWIGIDIQHGDLDIGDVAPLARVSPVPVLVRLASHDEAQLARVLDAGVDGVIVPAVESAGQARRLVQAAYFPPPGRQLCARGGRVFSRGGCPLARGWGGWPAPVNAVGGPSGWRGDTAPPRGGRPPGNPGGPRVGAGRAAPPPRPAPPGRDMPAPPG